MSMFDRITAAFRGTATQSKGFAGEAAGRREMEPLGAYTDVFSQWLPRQVSPRLYEALREAIPPLDAAIDRYCTLDGIVRVTGKNEALVAEIEDWAATVPVNDLQQGLQAFYTTQGNELYEQGFVIGEFVYSEAVDDVIGLRVADSKGVYFKRGTDKQLEVWYREPARIRTRADGMADIERLLRNGYAADTAVAQMLSREGYVKLDRALLTYDGFHVEGNNPYGTSLLRPMPFVARILLSMDNALGHTWSRFGDPMYHVNYKTAARVDAAELEKRRTTLATRLSDMINIRRNGNTSDFVTAVGKDDMIDIKVIGADNQVLEIEQPARHLLEQIVSKTGIPSWLLGFNWTTAERLAAKQCEILLQESKTRWVMRKPNLVRIIEAMLRARGRTWNRGDWDLVQEMPNVSDLVAIAQADFLRAQTELMRSGVTPSLGNGGATDDEEDPDAEPSDKRWMPAMLSADGHVVMPTDPGYPWMRRAAQRATRHKHVHRHKESFVEQDAALPRLERRLEKALVGGWAELLARTISALSLPAEKAASIAAKEDLPPFEFDANEFVPKLTEIMQQWIVEQGGPESETAHTFNEAWTRGVLNAAAELDQEAATVGEAARARAREALQSRGMTLVRDATIRGYRDDVLQQLAQGAYDGMSPKDVARALRERFGAHEYNWLRLARTEIASAQIRGKLAQYAELDITQYDWVSAPDACPVCVALAGAGPYTLGAGPLAPDDSHPECRCSVMAVVD